MMSTKRGSFRLVMLLTGLVLLLAGCFSKTPTPTKPKGPDPTPTSIEGRVTGPAALLALNDDETGTIPILATIDAKSGRFGTLFAGTRTFAATASITGETPLASVQVLVYELQDYLNRGGNAARLQQVETDKDGKFTITDVPTGKELFLLVPNVNARFGAIVPAIAKGKKTEANVNSSTTLVAEAWAPALDGGSSPDLKDRLARAVADASDVLNDLNFDGSALANALKHLIVGAFGDGLRTEGLSPELTRLVAALTAAIPEGNAACWILALDTYSFRPGTILGVEGIPWDWDDEFTFAELRAADGDEWVPAYIEFAGGNGAELFVPIHPRGGMDGGKASIVVYNEGSTSERIVCPPIAVDVQPLPPAMNTFEQLVDNLEQMFLARADVFGVDEHTLMTADLDEMGSMGSDQSHIVGLAAGLRTIKGDHPTSLRNILATKSYEVGGETYSFGDEDLALANAFLDASGLFNHLNTTAVEFANPIDNGLGQGSMGSFGSHAMAMRVQQNAGFVLPRQIATPSQLDTWMNVQARCARANSGAAADWRTIGGLALAGLSFTPAAPVAGTAGLVLAALELNLSMCEELLPAPKHLNFALAAMPVSFLEDQEGPGEWWGELTVDDRFWSVGWPDALSFIPAGGKIAGVLGKVMQQADAVIHFGEAMLGMMQTMMTEVWQQSESGRINLQGFPIAPIEIDPDHPEAKEYFKWEMHPRGGVLAFDFVKGDEKHYIPLEAGHSLLQVGTRRGKFQTDFPFEDTMELEVATIEVEITGQSGGMNRFYVEPGEKLNLIAHVHNADNEDVRWEWSAGDVKPQPNTVDDRLVTYTAPHEAGTHSVTAISVADTGARAPHLDPPDRKATVAVVVGGLQVLPKPACVSVGDIIQFRAYIGGEQMRTHELVFTHSGPGDLSVDGTFEATAEGDVTIDVWPVDEPGLGEKVRFRVDEDCSGFDVTVVGGYSVRVTSEDPRGIVLSHGWVGSESTFTGWALGRAAGGNFFDMIGSMNLVHVLVDEETDDPVDLAALAGGGVAHRNAYVNMYMDNIVVIAPPQPGLMLSAKVEGDTYRVTGEYSGIGVACDVIAAGPDGCDDDDRKPVSIRIRFDARVPYGKTIGL